MLTFTDKNNVKFPIGGYKEIEYDPDKKQLEFYKKEDGERIQDSGITLCGKAVQKFLDYMQLATATNKTNEIKEKKIKTTVSPTELFKPPAAAEPEAKKKKERS